MTFAEENAPEAVALVAAEAAFELFDDADRLELLQQREAAFFAALKAAKAEFGKIADRMTWDQVARAEENALDTLAEHRIDPSSFVGQIAFPRLATATAKLL